MTINKARLEFSKRVHLALDQLYDCPERESSGRTSYLASLFSVTSQNARRWLKGQHMPESLRMPDVAAGLQVQLLWLMTGEGIMTNKITNLDMNFDINPHIMVEVQAWIVSNLKVEAYNPKHTDPELMGYMTMVLYHMIQHGTKPENIDASMVMMVAKSTAPNTKK